MQFDGENLPDRASAALIAERRFQLWKYTCSHGMLLIRSPKSPSSGDEPARTNNIDIVCGDVRYISAPRFLGEIRIVQPTPDELTGFGNRVDQSLKASDLLVLENDLGRHHVVLAHYLVIETEGDEGPAGFEFFFNR